MNARLQRILGVLVLLALLASNGATGLAQSGRIKDKNSKPVPRPRAGSSPSSDSSQSTTSTPKNQTPQKDPPKNAAGEEIEETDIVRVSSNLVPIPASVVDPKGMAITGLKLEDFELRVDGQVKPISDMSRAETSVKLVMLFDNSGSLREAREFEKRAAMHFFRAVLRPSDEAAIYSIESESYLAQPLTRNIGLLEQTIASFGKPEGSTSLFDAIVDAAAYLRPYPGRRVMVVVSDGVDTTSRYDVATAIQQSLADDCQIFIVQTGLYDSANLRALAAERRMEQVASETGGAVYIPRSNTDLDVAFEQIAADLAQQYVLSYYPGDERRDGRFHVIDLRLRKRKDVRVRARKGYYSPKASNFVAEGW